jgi:hypothetical protein
VIRWVTARQSRKALAAPDVATDHPR